VNGREKTRAHGQVAARGKRNYSVYEISQTLKEQGTPLSATGVRVVLAAEGFARRAGSTRSVPSGSVPMRKPSPMSATSCSARASSPQGRAGCSCSSRIWCGSSYFVATKPTSILS
jgi:hypothetical protein